MDVLITEATGYTGSGIADALVAAGHRVSGLARSDESARKLEERDIRAVKGDITDAGSVREAARGAETVVHAALMHGEGAEEAERTVVGAVLDVLRGTGRTFVYNSGVWCTLNIGCMVDRQLYGALEALRLPRPGLWRRPGPDAPRRL